MFGSLCDVFQIPFKGFIAFICILLSFVLVLRPMWHNYNKSNEFAMYLYRLFLDCRYHWNRLFKYHFWSKDSRLNEIRIDCEVNAKLWIDKIQSSYRHQCIEWNQWHDSVATHMRPISMVTRHRRKFPSFFSVTLSWLVFFKWRMWTNRSVESQCIVRRQRYTGAMSKHLWGQRRWHTVRVN